MLAARGSTTPPGLLDEYEAIVHGGEAADASSSASSAAAAPAANLNGNLNLADAGFDVSSFLKPRRGR
jgi:hypothetical protein